MSLVQRRFRVLKGLRFYDIMFFWGPGGSFIFIYFSYFLVILMKK
jgi:hypothetical protein